MSVPMSKDVASLVLSEKANQLAHDAIGVRGRRLANGLAVLATLSGVASGVTGLADLAGKTGVAILGLLAGVSAACAVLALTMLKSADHLRTAGEYESLFLRTIVLDDSVPDREERLEGLREEFDDVVGNTRKTGVSLTNGQVLRYEKQARAILAYRVGPASAARAEVISLYEVLNP